MLVLLWKDLRIELRTRETVSSLLVLGLLILLVLSLAVDPTSDSGRAAAPGVLWAALIFAGTLGVNRGLLRETEQSSLHGLLLAPVDRGSLFFAKALANFFITLTAELSVLVAFVVFFNLPFLRTIAVVAPILLLGLLGFSALGTLFGAVSLRTRAREVMLPLLVLPLVVPLFLACVEATAIVLQGEALRAASDWLKLLVAFDFVFLVVGWITFEYVVEE